MEYSKHNIISKIADSDNYYIVNVLSGNADIVSEAEVKNILENKVVINQDFIDKGYLVNSLEEKKIYNQKYLKFIDEREQDEVQLFITPWYECNFACSYCFQDEYSNQNSSDDLNWIKSFFEYIDKEFSERRKYITIFGGEPLLLSDKKHKVISEILKKSKERNLEVAIVTNGYNILEYIEELKNSNIREIQVTIDGTKEIHDGRRKLKGGKGSFDKIVQGVDALLENNISVNLRVIIDKENISNIPKLADFAIEKSWTRNSNFKTGFGRNYELHHCQKNNSKLFSRIEMYIEIYNLVKKHPQILEFHKPAFSISKFIFENGELPDPLFDSCSGCKTEWAFDSSGKIYSCTATVGNSGDELGTFYPIVNVDSKKVEEWESRDVLSISECKNCSMQLACGGGCAAVARTKNGNLNSPDCRPIKDLLKYGIGLYFDDEK